MTTRAGLADYAAITGSVLTLVLTSAVDTSGRLWNRRRVGGPLRSRSVDNRGHPWTFLILLRIR